MHEVCQKYLCLATKEILSWANEREMGSVKASAEAAAGNFSQ